MIYSLNARQGIAPELTTASIVGDSVTFDNVPVPYDSRPGPCVIFVVTYVGAFTINDATVNGFAPDDFFSVFTSVDGQANLAVIVAKFSASRYSVTVNLSGSASGRATITGYAFGNCDSIFFTKASENADIPFSQSSLDVFCPGTMDLGNVLVFTATTTTADRADNTQILVSSSPSLPFVYPDANFSTIDSSATAAAYSISSPASLDTILWTYTNLPDGGDPEAIFHAAAIAVAITSLPDEDPFNCDCDDITPNSTLAQLRRRLLIRLGYAAQADSPPPGMAALLDDFLLSAQRFLYGKFPGIRTERFFSWTMTPGERFYDLPDNDETCSKQLNPYKVTWAGIEDLNGAWYKITKGIPPEFYTMVNFQGIPSRYEIRQCIEVLPAPAAAYKLRIKGHFGLTAFTADDDKTTIDSELVFLWALGNAKAHYGQADAANVASEADVYLKGLIGGSHQTARYVPGTHEVPAMTPPIFLPLQP